PDARFVGFGGMLTEGFLAVLVILACCAGLGLGLPLISEKDPAEAAPNVIIHGTRVQYRDASGAERSYFMTGRSMVFVNTPPPPPGSELTYGGGQYALVGAAAFNTQYESWGSAKGLDKTVGAFVTGAGNFCNAIGIPMGVCVALMGVLVAS